MARPHVRYRVSLEIEFASQAESEGEATAAAWSNLEGVGASAHAARRECVRHDGQQLPLPT
jgi:hypothetical protein